MNRCRRIAVALAALLIAAGSFAVPASAHENHDHHPPREEIWKNRWDQVKYAIPDAPVYDQDGRKLSFYSDLVKGRTVAVNFIYTSCSAVCSPLTATFRRVQAQLGERVGRDVQLISVSVDPANDTPAVLKKFSAQFDVQPGWTFVTGSKADIDRVLKAFGVFNAKRDDHTPMILVGNDAEGRWTRTYGLAPADAIVETVRKTAGSAGHEHHHHGKAEATPAASSAYFPNLPLVTQDNRPVRFYDDLVRGKIVLINTMYAGCTGVCSPMTATLAKVRRALGAYGDRVQFVSITVDPGNDTPEVLRKYADKHQVGEGWQFVTGKKENVDWVLYKLGGYVPDKADHSPVLVLGNDAAGEWRKIVALASPEQIAEEVRRLIDAGRS